MHVIAEPLAALWNRTRAMFSRALRAIGAPEAIAAARSLAEDRRRAIALWLGLLEHIVRELLLAESARGQRPETRAQAFGPACVSIKARSLMTASARVTQPPARALDLTEPQTWPAHFSFAIPRDPRAVLESRAPRIRALWDAAPASSVAKCDCTRPDGERNAPLRLAFRLEALRRVLADPASHAARLARLLRRLRRRFPEVIRRLVCAPARVCFFDPQDSRLSIEASGAALDVENAYSDSS
jgi:hypothetical protein